MLNRAHLLSRRLGDALLHEHYATGRLGRDLVAAIAAIPLSMAFASACGIAPQHGLYTAIIGSVVLALIGDACFSISGLSAAVVVILYPIAHKLGLAGVLVVSLLAGAMLVGMALLRLGWLMEYLPAAAARGMATGIGILVATLQLRDFLGVDIDAMPVSFGGQLGALATALPQTHWPDAAVGCATLAVMLLWSRLKTSVPVLLPAVLVGVSMTMALNAHGLDVATIGSHFGYALADGTTGHGIAPVPPEFAWPWLQPGAKGSPIPWSLAVIQTLLPSAFSIAMLAAMQSPGFDAVADKRSGVNSNLLQQGIGNLVVPFFGGITVAPARAMGNTNTGIHSRISGIIRAIFILLVVVLFAPSLGYLPVASLATLIMAAAWNVSEVRKTVHMFNTASRNMIVMLLAWLSFTLLFDLTIVITSGVLFATVLFVRDVARSTSIIDISISRQWVPHAVPPSWRVIRLNGSLFFAVADRVFAELGALAEHKNGLIMHLAGVPMLDDSCLVELQRFIAKCEESGTRLIFAEMQFPLFKALREKNTTPATQKLEITATLQEALARINTERPVASTTAAFF